jgi:NNP family nitrate/nitrite transporter-like MFS transporter
MIAPVEATELASPHPPTLIKGRWLLDWRPEDEVFWQAKGNAIAARNLAASFFSEHTGFSIWSLSSVFALFLGTASHPRPGLSPPRSSC